MKHCFFISAFCLFCLLSYGQRFEPYHSFEIGAGITLNATVGDAETIGRTASPHININYNPNLYTVITAEYQVGKLKGGDSVLTLSGRQFSSNFNAFFVKGQLQAGHLFGQSDVVLTQLASDFYIGSGIGIIFNNIKEVNRTSRYFQDYYTGGPDKSQNLLIPLRVGYDFKVLNYYKEVLFRIDAAYQHNLMLGDGMDGFDAGSSKDILPQFSLSLKVGLSGKRRTN